MRFAAALFLFNACVGRFNRTLAGEAIGIVPSQTLQILSCFLRHLSARRLFSCTEAPRVRNRRCG
jgi:hypothetical protein